MNWPCAVCWRYCADDQLASRCTRLAGLRPDRYAQRHRWFGPAGAAGADGGSCGVAAVTASAAAISTPEPSPRPPRTEPAKRNRGALPAHLPRTEVVIDVDDKACPCCGGMLHVIGEDRAEMLDYVPAQLRVRAIRRPRYGCRACEEAVVQAPAPERPIDGGMATEALLAHVLVNKYADHRVPRTHRQRWRCGAV
jgi:transposase